MLSAINLSELIHLATLIVGVLLLVKKIAEMDRFHFERVFLLTLFLSGLLFYLLDYSFGELMRLSSPMCMPDIY